MTADMKVAAAGGTRCELCHTWTNDPVAHAIREHLVTPDEERDTANEMHAETMRKEKGE